MAYDGMEWNLVAEGGINDPGNLGFTALKSHEGTLYAGSMSARVGLEIDFSQELIELIEMLMGIIGMGEEPQTMQVPDFLLNLIVDKLVEIGIVVTLESKGANLYAYADGNWEQVDEKGFGDPRNIAVTDLHVHEDDLFVSTASFAAATYPLVKLGDIATKEQLKDLLNSLIDMLMAEDAEAELLQIDDFIVDLLPQLLLLLEMILDGVEDILEFLAIVEQLLAILEQILEGIADFLEFLLILRDIMDNLSGSVVSVVTTDFSIFKLLQPDSGKIYRYVDGELEEIATEFGSEDYAVLEMESINEVGQEMLLVSMASNDHIARIHKYNGEQWLIEGEPAFGDEDNYAVSSLLAFDDAIYAGTSNRETGCQIWYRAVEGLKLESVDPIDDLTVSYGTSAAKVIDTLPQTVGGILNDGSEVILDISWAADEDYFAENPGEYTFTGMLSAGEGDDYSIPGELAIVEVTVTLKAMPVIQLSVGDYTVTEGEEFWVDITVEDGGSLFSGFTFELHTDPHIAAYDREFDVNTEEYILTGETTDIWPDLPFVVANAQQEEYVRLVGGSARPIKDEDGAFYRVKMIGQNPGETSLMFVDTLAVGLVGDETRIIPVEATPGSITVMPKHLPGDVGGTGEVEIADAILVLRHVAGLIDLRHVELFGEGAFERALVSGGEEPRVEDAVLILRYIAGLIDDF